MIDSYGEVACGVSVVVPESVVLDCNSVLRSEVQDPSEKIPRTRPVCNIYIDVRSSGAYCFKGMLNLISIQPQVSEHYAILKSAYISWLH
jgi:hypothetical protein